MSAILYNNIGSCVYKPFGGYAYGCTNFDSGYRCKNVHVEALYTQNKGNTRVVKLQSKAAIMKAKIDEVAECVDSRDVRMLKAAIKAEKLMFRGSGCC